MDRYIVIIIVKGGIIENMIKLFVHCEEKNMFRSRSRINHAG